MEFFDDPSSTREEILAAAYRALCTYGYSDLTIKRIGEELEKSPSLVYHHYGSKDELLVGCLESMLDQFERNVSRDDLVDPRESIERMFHGFFVSESPPEQRRFMRSLVELRGQAPHDDRYRAHFTRSDRVFQSRLAELVETGVDRGDFKPVDPERMASMLLVLLTGVHLRYTTTDDDSWLEDVRTSVDSYLEAHLYA